MNQTIVKAKLIRAKISPKKVGPVVDLIKNRNLREAKVLLKFDTTKAAKLLLKVLKSAESNAVTNNKIEKENLYIHEVSVGPGPMMKSGMFAGRGYFRPILKRTSNIYVSLGERKRK